MPVIDVLDSFMHYSDTGEGDVPVVFLHGNPTSSYLWRNVIPHVRGEVRALAPDLIGMGESGKPDIGYRFADHARYLDAWFDALDLDRAVLVGHDWGGALAMHRLARHPERVRGIAVLETFLRPLSWAEMPPQGADLFRGFRSPEGARMILQENMFIEFNLPFGAKSLTPADLDVYRAPYPTPESRRPMLVWPREIPFDGEPADVAAIMTDYGRAMADTPQIPKLLMAVENGIGMGGNETIDWATTTFANIETVGIGPAGHHAPEDQPDAIGKAIAQWLGKHDLSRPSSSIEKVSR
ncbi:haloalkane dehalogenase [Nocardia macrotermitis]|uniref:Haloalkane dehalogenase n=1 Tax=Nocardia macrotermitis TaxID=2585198 RepID=A0A7K0DEI7_9NOCA|nr:haloalkane dehalogenase [Nocardia macrotermitis]MQY24049.1 Haloalkane dehalogenase [Nocardia macrotermitis]